MSELRECPFCGSTDIGMYAFSLDTDCRIACECGAQIEAEVPWKEMNEKEHDAECRKVLKPLWNTRPTEDALRKRVAELEERENQFWEMVHNSFEIETREELEEEAKRWSHGNAMECAVHAMWKRDPQVAELQKRVGELEDIVGLAVKAGCALREMCFKYEDFSPSDSDIVFRTQTLLPQGPTTGSLCKYCLRPVDECECCDDDVCSEMGAKG